MKIKYILLLALLNGCFQIKNKEITNTSEKNFFREKMGENYQQLLNCMKSNDAKLFRELLKENSVITEGPILVKVIKSKKLTEESKVNFVKTVLEEKKSQPDLGKILEMKGNISLLKPADCTKNSTSFTTPQFNKEKIEVTPLIAAILYAPSVVKELIVYKINVNNPDLNGKTALMYACGLKESNFIEYLTKILIKCNAKINAQNKKGKTALMIAAKGGLIKEADFLLANKAKINAEDSKGRTALSIAIKYKQFNMVNYLLDKNAKIEEVNASGEPILIEAIKNKQIDLANFLILNPKLNVNLRDREGKTPLMHAIDKGKTTALLAEALLSRQDLGINLKDNNNETAFMFAAKKGNCKMVKQLALKSAINDGNNNGKTALTLAVENKHFKTTKILLRLGAEIKDELTIAASMGHIEFIKELSLNNNIVNNMNSEGKTALICALEARHIDVIKYLLETANADINIRDSNNKTALMYATENGDIEIAKILILNKADINLKNINGLTPLHLAVKKSNKEMIKLLIANNADVNSQCAYGMTPLHWAAKNGNKEIAELLILNHININVNSKDIRGMTPLHWAAWWMENKGLAKLLILNGANVNSRDDKDRTPLSWASRNGNKKVEKLLKSYRGTL